MKSSIKGLVVILVIVMSFVLVQGIWARENIVLTIFEGVVTSDTSADNRTIGIDTNDDGNLDRETDFTIYHMGPSWYWEDEEVYYPMEGEYLKIVASYCEILGDYVGVSVCYLDKLEDGTCSNSIQLRDPTTLKPLWNPKAKTTDLSDTAVEATGDGEPIEHNYDYNYDKEYDNNYDNKYESSGPNGK